MCACIYMYISPTIKIVNISTHPKKFPLNSFAIPLFHPSPSLSLFCHYRLSSFYIILCTLNQIVCTSTSTLSCLASFIHMIILLLESINSAFPFLGVAFHCMHTTQFVSHSAGEHFCCFGYYS